jgi:hypothetical protein
MDLSALSAMNLGNFGSAASFADLGQLAKRLHEGAEPRGIRRRGAQALRAVAS